MATCTLDQTRAAKKKAVESLSMLAPVVGVGITRIGEGYGLKVNLECEPAAALPAEVDGVPIRVEIVGKIGKRQLSG